ncbi:MAG: hypothetical protein WC219_01420 [Acholeplasmataceae bacterium]
MNTIELIFSNSIVTLTGNPFGRKIYETQVKEKFRYNEINEILFPEHIEKVAISFSQGLIHEILGKINKNELEKYIVIKASSDELQQKILADMKF